MFHVKHLQTTIVININKPITKILLSNSYHNVGADSISAQNKITYLFIQTILFIYLTFIYPNILLSTDISRLQVIGCY